MRLPFTREQFFEVFAAYNAAIWPAAMLAYLIAALALIFAWRRASRRPRVVAAVLALMWAWVGIVYHGLFFAPINPAAWLFALGFAVQAALCAWHARRGQDLEMAPPGSARAIAGGVMTFYALFLYPMIGLAAGERYPEIPLFGITPCPLVIFTLGLLLWMPSARWWLWPVPLLWSLVGGSAAILLSVPQDWALPASGILALLILHLDRRRSSSGQDRAGPGTGTAGAGRSLKRPGIGQ